MLNIFLAAALAFPISGPNCYDCPISREANMMEKIAMNMSSGFSPLFCTNFTPAKKIMDIVA